MANKAGVILNPVAGKKKGKAMLGDFCEGICRLEYDITLGVTTKQGDATEKAKRYSPQHEILCCIGGDGTLNEVITGLMSLPRAERAPLCYLPTGTTNDFAAACSIPNDVMGALDCLTQGKTVNVDIGSFDERFFTYIASFGLFTRSSYATDQAVKNVIGHLAYVLEGAKELQTLGKKYHLRVKCDQGIFEDDYIFGGVANTTSLGGIFQLPRKLVTLNDGKFELLLIRYPTTADELIRTLNMIQTGSFDGEQVVLLQTEQVEFTAQSPISWCLDGEFAGDREKVKIQNRKRALTLFAKAGMTPKT